MTHNYEVPFSNAKKDANGYAKLVVRVGEWYVPALGKPVSFTAYDRCHYLIGEDIAEIKRLNLTKWDLKDIPEIREKTGKLFGCESILYWNGNECAWKFFEDCFYGIDDESDEVIKMLDDYLDEHDDEFYKPHDDHARNFGNTGAHCVYFGNSNVKIFSDCDDEKAVESWDENEYVKPGSAKLGSVEIESLDHLGDEATELVRHARQSHKKIPYAEIGRALREFVSTETDDVKLGKEFTDVF